MAAISIHYIHQRVKKTDGAGSSDAVIDVRHPINGPFEFSTTETASGIAFGAVVF